MTDFKALQQTLFQQIRQQLPGHIAVVDEIAASLGLSADSAYRRIRGEKMLTFDELGLLCQRFGVSLDGLLQVSSQQVLFSATPANFSQFDLTEHLTGILDQLKQLASFSPCRMYYLAKDVPLFHYFHFPELALFKFFAWLKTIRHTPAFNQRKFIPEELVNTSWHQLSKEIVQTYNGIPSEEIWSVETIYSTLRQIEYCREALLFDREATIQSLYEQLLQLIHHIEEEAAAGYKYTPGKEVAATGGEYRLYYHGALLGDNTIVMQMGEAQRVYLNHAILNYIHTGNEGFCTYTMDALRTIIRKSTLISTVGEKDRSKFFNTLRGEVQRRMTIV
jgi:hypothetical protein